MKQEFYDRLDPRTGEVISRGLRTVIEGDSLTKQSMRDECDINKIMERFEKGKIITHTANREAYFADVSQVPDFAAAVEIVRKAEEMFMSLPAKLRSRFDNDPAAYVQFTADPANRDEMVALGLIPKPEPAPAPVEVVVTNPVVPPA